MVKERGILFSAPMVRALLEERKTQTRRLLRPLPGVSLPDKSEPGGWEYLPAPGAKCSFLFRSFETADEIGGTSIPIPRCPYGVPGDRLWVRERIDRLREGLEVATAFGDRAVYAADGALTKLDTWPWKRHTLPGIHCPRGLSRITLEITDVRVQRLHDITEEDARAEGVELSNQFETYRASFAWLWGQIHEEGWNASDPWLWAISFRRVTP